VSQQFLHYFQIRSHGLKQCGVRVPEGLLVQVSRRQFIWLERLPVTHASGPSQELRLFLAGDWNWLSQPPCFRSRVASRTRATESAKVILWAQYLTRG
jgi:hypothetical protein